MKLLHINASIMGDKSVTRQLSQDIVDHYINENPSAQVITYDLDKNPIPFLSSASFTDKTEQAIAEKTLNDFLEADIIVIGTPMYNFGIPAQLKAWVDRISVAGTTFKYTENGPQGLITDKKIIIASSRGSAYGPDTAHLDHQEKHLQSVFGLFGLTGDAVQIIRTEGVNLAPDAAEKEIAKARTEIPALA